MWNSSTSPISLGVSPTLISNECHRDSIAKTLPPSKPCSLPFPLISSLLSCHPATPIVSKFFEVEALNDPFLYTCTLLHHLYFHFIKVAKIFSCIGVFLSCLHPYLIPRRLLFSPYFSIWVLQFLILLSRRQLKGAAEQLCKSFSSNGDSTARWNII